MILRRAARDLRQLGARAILVMLAVALAAGTGAGALLALDNVTAARESFYRRYRLADLEMSLKQPVPATQLLERARRSGATHASVRLIVPGEIRTSAGPVAAYFVGMSKHAQLDRLDLLRGRGLTQLGKEGAVIEQDFARVHHIALGQRIKVSTYGFNFELTVQGIGRTPDSLYATADPEYFIIQRGSLAYVFLPLARVQQTATSVDRVAPGSADDLLLDVPAAGDHAPAMLTLTHGEPVDHVTPKREQFGYRITQNDLTGLSGFIPVLSIILSAVAALLILVTIVRLVQNQRRELGTMLALGHPRWTVVLAGALPALTLGILGGVLAVPASVGVARLITAEYSTSHGFLAVPTRLTPVPAALAFGLAAGMTVIAAALPAVRLARLLPTTALRGDTPPPTSRLPVWAQTATEAPGVAGAYAMRSIMRRPARSALTVVGLAGAIGLAISLHVAETSVTTLTSDWFKRQAWTHTIVFQRPTAQVAAVRTARQAGARRIEPIVDGSVQLAGPRGELGVVSVVGVPGAPSLQDVGLPRGGPAAGTVFVSAQVMHEFGLRVGQRLTLSGPHSVLSVTIAGVATTLAEQDCYLPLAAAQALLGLNGEATSALVEGGSSIAASLRESPIVSQVVKKAAIQRGLSEILSELTLLMNAVVGISLAVGIFFLISSLIISVLERQHEFALLRALGWSGGDIVAVILGECSIMVGFGATLGALAAPGIASPIIDRLSTVWFHIGYALRPSSFLSVIVPALALTPFVAIYMALLISRLDIARVVRARTSG